MAFVMLKRKLAPPPQGTWGSRNPEEKAKGDQIAKNLHLPNANDSGGMLLTMDCWDCQIKPHRDAGSVAPTGRHIPKSLDYDIALCLGPALLHPLGVCVGI